MGREDTAPRILNLDNNNTAAACFTHQSFVTGGSKPKNGGKQGGKQKEKSEFTYGRRWALGSFNDTF